MTANVQTMGYVGATPWHGLGVKIRDSGLATAAEMVIAAGLDWQVGLMETETFHWVSDPSGARNPDGSPFLVKHYLPNSTRSVVRLDTLTVLDEGVMRFTPYQNADMFAWVDGIVGAAGAVYHTAGALDGGRKVWVLVELPGDVYVGPKKDAHKKFILIVNSHAKGYSLKIVETMVRAVCQNTVNQAVSGAALDEIVKISHMPNIVDRADKAKTHFGIINRHYDEMQKLFDALVFKPLDAATLNDATTYIWPMPNDTAKSDGADARRKMVMRLREKTVQFYETGVGAEMYPGSAYNLITATSEVTTHLNGKRTREAQLEYATIGDGAAAQARAMQFARQLLG